MSHQRYFLTLEYDGGPFAGWQRQAEQPSVQGTLEAAAAHIEGAPVTVWGAGRTDAGVHARGQVAHLDLRLSLPWSKVADALNYHLRPHPIAVLAARPVSPDVHARFDANARQYRYEIENRRAALALAAGRAWRIAQPLDIEVMRRAALALLGQHDFSTFRDAQCQAKSPVRTLDRLEILQNGSRIEIICAARSFLHRQVRSIVGSLVEVGRGRHPENWIGEILAARSRAACGPVAPAAGLYLEAITYPDSVLPTGDF